MKNNEYLLYLDLDGVLVDFQRGYTDLSRDIDWHGISQEEWENQVRKKYGAASSKPEWWAGLNWVRGGQEVWKAAEHLFSHVCILSSASTSDPVRFQIVEDGKRQWLKKNMPQIKDKDVFIVEGKAFKRNYASKNAILVDDVTATINDWNDAGGFGILHDAKRYKNTIETLVEVASPINLSEIVKRFRK